MFEIGDKVRVIKGYYDAKKGDEGIIRAFPETNGSSRFMRKQKILQFDF